MQVPSGETLHVKVWDYDALSRNELLGDLEIDMMREVQSAPGGDITKTWDLQNVATDWMAVMGRRADEAKQATITLRIQFIPFRSS